MGLISKIFGTGNDGLNVKEMLENGAVVIDVRSRGEFQGGHVAGSKNIPLQEIESKLDEIKKMNKAIVLCCASGARSGQATRFLKSKDVVCINGGGWTRVQRQF
jgi:phage shock protein E